jgi:DNA-binding IclR family transcriptional regulator
VPSPQPVRYTARVGASNPLHTGAMGKVLLAFSDPGDLGDLLDRMTLTASTDRTITDRRKLEDELNTIRGSGYAVSRGEQAVGVAAMSAPILRSDGVILAALSVLGPTDRLTDEKLQELLPILRAAATTVTERVAHGSDAVMSSVARD